MRNLTATICLTIAVLLGSAGVSESADFQKGLTAAQRGDFATALREWRPLAEQGDAYAQYNLGQMYATGRGVSQDHKTAAKWFRLAAKGGHADAQRILGMTYEIGGEGVPQDYKTALKWYRLAAKQGNAYAQDDLKNLQKIIAKAKASLSSPKVSADYQRGLDAYSSGDYATALREFEPLAEQGDADAQYNLGFMYDKGKGVLQDYKTAVKWYRLSAEQGDALAQKKLSILMQRKKAAAKKTTAEKAAREKQRIARAKQSSSSILKGYDSSRASHSMTCWTDQTGWKKYEIKNGYVVVDNIQTGKIIERKGNIFVTIFPTIIGNILLIVDYKNNRVTQKSFIVEVFDCQ